MINIQQRLFKGDASALVLLQPAGTEPAELTILVPQFEMVEPGPAEMPVFGDVPGLEGVQQPGILLHPAADGQKGLLGLGHVNLLQHGDTSFLYSPIIGDGPSDVKRRFTVYQKIVSIFLIFVLFFAAVFLDDSSVS